jgi:hypothetical protein
VCTSCDDCDDGVRVTVPSKSPELAGKRLSLAKASSKMGAQSGARSSKLRARELVLVLVGCTSTESTSLVHKCARGRVCVCVRVCARIMWCVHLV